MESSRVQRAVLVQSSIYGWDNTFLLDTLRRHPDSFVGVVLVDPSSPGLEADMTRLSEHPQVKGARFHALTPRHSEELSNAWGRIAATAARLDWIIAVQVEPGGLAKLHRWIQTAPETGVVIDHLGLVSVRENRDTVRELLAFSRYPNVSIKVSGLEALSATGYPFADVRVLFDAVLGEFGPHRLMWGSNFPQVAGACSYSEILGVVEEWLSGSSDADRTAVLQGTATRVWRID